MSGRHFLAVLIFFFCGIIAHGPLQAALEDEELWQQGQKELAAGDIPRARRHLEELLSKYPEESRLHLVVGLAALKAQDAAGAGSHVAKAVELAPNDSEALTLLGWIELEVKNDPEKAIEAYERVVELKPEIAEAHNNLGVALERKGDLDRAVESFSHALAQKEDYVQALSNRGWALLNQSKWEAAEKDFEKSLELDPKDQGALYGLARVRKSKRDYAGAQDALARLGHESPNFIYWLEWASIGAVRYYWVLLLLTIGLWLYFRYKRRMGVKSNG